MSRKLTLTDIKDTREYEREREDFRMDVIALKKRRRVEVGSFLSLAFECRDTIRFQIQEMARVERLATDAAIEGELTAYNPLIPEAGQLSATLFLELTSDEQLREWLPKLVGIERSIELRIDNGDTVVFEPDSDHAAQLTREESTAAVHYIHASMTTQQIDAFAESGGDIVVAHDAYPHRTTLTDDTIAELLADLRG